MARSKRIKPPTPQQVARYGIDSLSFTIPKIISPSVHSYVKGNEEKCEIAILNEDAQWLQGVIQKYINPCTLFTDLKVDLPNGLYSQVFSLSTRVENPNEVRQPGQEYKGQTAVLMRVSCNPRPKSLGKLYENNTTSFQLHGELLKRIDYLPLLKWIIGQNGKVTKMDLFKDDFDWLLVQERIHALSQVSEWNEHVNSRLVRCSGDIMNGDNLTYYGNAKTIQVCIYNKAVEEKEKFQHVRVELRLRKAAETATGFVRKLVEDPLQECRLISSLIDTYIKFQPRHANNSYHRNKIPPYGWWLSFLGATSPIKIKEFQHGQKGNALPLSSLTVQQLKTRQAWLVKKRREVEDAICRVELLLAERDSDTPAALIAI